MFENFQKTDEAELESVGKFFSKYRKEPLKIGSVKGNYGHSEVSSVMFGLFKVLVAMDKGIIPATVNYSKPNSNIKYLTNGQLEVVTKNQEWDSTFAAVNALSYCSSFGHIILRGNPKPKMSIKCDLPLLTCFSTRTENGISEIVDIVSNK